MVIIIAGHNKTIIQSVSIDYQFDISHDILFNRSIKHLLQYAQCKSKP